ncbi:hypothetical protein GYMLUDRAFT_34523 [Collybiopsis luxurians FD-317 M1]|nr:hypothetical protein GYMLUDRAFT_34523 [Collybiopsis luxurians FD-317 M1]
MAVHFLLLHAGHCGSSGLLGRKAEIWRHLGFVAKNNKRLESSGPWLLFLLEEEEQEQYDKDSIIITVKVISCAGKLFGTF